MAVNWSFREGGQSRAGGAHVEVHGMIALIRLGYLTVPMQLLLPTEGFR